jgi:PleD family two-component response regulator
MSSRSLSTMAVRRIIARLGLRLGCSCFPNGQERAVLQTMAAANRLLIVDDEQGITLEAVAQKLGFNVRAIHHSEQFEKALGQIDPTVILLDIAMPERDGMELIGLLAAKSYAGKVVVMSGSDPRYIQMFGHRQNAWASDRCHAPKPF